MSENSKYLISIIIKGKSGEFTLVIEWYKFVLTNLEVLIKILDKSDEGWNSASQLLELFKYGLNSESQEVTQWCSKLLGQFSLELNKRNLSGPIWEWFISDDIKVFEALIQCLKRFPLFPIESIIVILCQFGKYNYTELFNHYLKQQFAVLKDYIEIVTKFITPLAEYQESRSEIVSSGVIDSWINMGCQS